MSPLLYRHSVASDWDMVAAFACRVVREQVSECESRDPTQGYDVAAPSSEHSRVSKALRFCYNG
jgi:hypothetical protein